jgi:hypothetical protein
MSKVITLVVGLMVGFSAGHYYGQRKARTVLSVVSSTSVQPVVRPGRTVVWNGRGVSIDFPGDSPCTKAPVAFPFECVVKGDAEGIYPYKICANADCSLFIDPTIKVGTTGGMHSIGSWALRSLSKRLRLRALSTATRARTRLPFCRRRCWRAQVARCYGRLRRRWDRTGK